MATEPMKNNKGKEKTAEQVANQLRSHRWHEIRSWVRRILLACCLVGFVCVAFWDELFEHGHGHDPNGDPAECPYVQMTGGAENPVASKSGESINHDDMVSFQGLPELETLLPRKPLLEMKYDDLSKFDGTNSGGILLAIDGFVVDVTEGKKVYGPGGGYSVFAGKTVTRAMALSSMKESDLTDDISNLDEHQLKRLENWKRYIFHKYPIIATLLPQDSEWNSRFSVIRSILGNWIQFAPEPIRNSVTSKRPAKVFSSVSSWVNLYLSDVKNRTLSESINSVSWQHLLDSGMKFVVYDSYAFDISSGSSSWSFDENNGIWNSFQGRNVTLDVMFGPTKLPSTPDASRNSGTVLKKESVDLKDRFHLFHKWMLGYWLENFPVIGKVLT